MKLRTLFLSLLLCVPLFGQSFPTSIYTPLVAKNNVQTTLTSAMTSGDTTAVVASTTGWAANMMAYICDTTTVTSSVARCSGTFEVMKVTAVPSSVLLTVTRAQDGTSAIAHSSGKGVLNAPTAIYNTWVNNEVLAIETALGTNLSNIPTSPIMGSATYNFAAQSPTSPATLTAGSRTITLPGGCPSGVNGTDSGHRLAVLGGGTNEAALITGGDCTSGATGSTHTVTLTIANSHSAGYTIASATAGIQEAIQVLNTAGTGGRVYVPKGTLTIYGPIVPPAAYTYWIEGTGRSSTVLSVASTFCNPSGTPGVCGLSINGVFDFSPAQPTATAADNGGVTGLTIGFVQPNSSTLTDYTHWPPAVYASGNNHVTASWVLIERAWDAITSPSSNGVTISHVGMSFFHRGITIDACGDVLGISNTEAWVFGLDTLQSILFRAPATANYFLDIQQADFGYITDIASDSGKFATLHKNGGGSVPTLVGVNWDIDTNGGFEMSNGYVRLSNINVSTLPGTAAFSISGGTLVIDGVVILNSGSTTAMFTYAPSQANAGAAAGLQPGLFISNLQTSASAEDQYIVYATTAGAFSGTGTVQIRGGAISKSPGQVYTKELFVEAAGTGSIVYDVSHVKIGSNAAVAAVAFNFASSNAHAVSYTDGPGGWTYTVPATTRWFNNSGFTSNINSIPLATTLAGNLIFTTDNTYDLGASGATRPRNGFFGTSVTVGATGGYVWTGLSQILSPSDGVIRLSNNAGTAFTRLQFGGTTSAFPAIKRSSDVLHMRLADDSGFAGFHSLFLQTNAASGMDIYLRGATSAFPAIQRSGTTVKFRLADDSADAPITAAAITGTTITGTAVSGSTSVSGATYLTATNCSSAAAPAVCAAAAAGSVVVAAAGTTVTVNTTAVTANSQIFLTEDSGLGTKLTVTCNVTPATALTVTARTAATSFVITTNAPATNPRCISYRIVN